MPTLIPPAPIQEESAFTIALLVHKYFEIFTVAADLREKAAIASLAYNDVTARQIFDMLSHIHVLR